MVSKVILIVLDSVGIGASPDAAHYGDEGSHTIRNIWMERGELRIPNLIRLGLGNITGSNLPQRTDHPIGCFGKSMEASPGKDTVTGHWEIAGIVLDKAFPTYPDGFPMDIIHEFESKIHRKILGNYAASGTEIIDELGPEHMKTGYPIVYTSADSVFQIAAHENIIPLEELYDACCIAREILKGEHAVGRVIARPFIGEPGSFRRTGNRKDFSLESPEYTMLDVLKMSGKTVAAVGKIEDIFSSRGITKFNHAKRNIEGIKATIAYMEEDFTGLIFTNLIDFDMLYGHRNDLEGYAKALEEFDSWVPILMDKMGEKDVLIITADHGCDPTTPSTDHSREYVPILVYGQQIKQGINIGIRKSFSDISATVLDMFHIEPLKNGTSFYKDIMRD
ncbi:MAG: phosphopentomutase [Clostridia bacterium]|jgi:phosphopentomutase